MNYLEELIQGKGSTIEVMAGGYEHKSISKVVICKDGTQLSVQGSTTHYSSPRNNHGVYYEMEVGFPTVAPPETWAKHFDGDWESGDLTGSVYGYVPVELIREFVELHGGIETSGETWNCHYCLGTNDTDDVCISCGNAKTVL